MFHDPSFDPRDKPDPQGVPQDALEQLARALKFASDPTGPKLPARQRLQAIIRALLPPDFADVLLTVVDSPGDDPVAEARWRAQIDCWEQLMGLYLTTAHLDEMRPLLLWLREHRGDFITAGIDEAP
jgi:hypothetical protein